MEEFLHKLCSFPHRGSTSANEAEAAEFIKDSLNKIGLKPEEQIFRSPATYSWEIIIISLFLSAGVVLSVFYPIPGTITVIIGFFFFLRHFTLRPSPLSGFIPKFTSRNIYGRIQGQEPAEQHILLMAHYDSAKASALFSPKMVRNFRSNFKINTSLAVISIPWCFLGIYWNENNWYLLISVLLAINFFSNVLIHLHREIFHKFTPGANDNASGCAVIYALAEYYTTNPLKNVDLHILFTGCEEVGAYGANHFLSEAGKELPPEKTIVLNFDNVGAGKLHYATGEGMLIYYPYEPRAVRIMEKICESDKDIAEALEYRIAYFDTLPFVHQSYPCLTFIALGENKNIPNWHWYSDTVENIEMEVIKHTFETGKKLIDEITKTESG